MKGIIVGSNTREVVKRMQVLPPREEKHGATNTLEQEVEVEAVARIYTAIKRAHVTPVTE